jgi:hypothetical protein
MMYHNIRFRISIYDLNTESIKLVPAVFATNSRMVSTDRRTVGSAYVAHAGRKGAGHL